MGGLGCGNWSRIVKKSTVEESLAVSMRDLRARLYHGAVGTFTWTWRSGGKSSISFAVTLEHDSPTVTLDYRWQGREDVRIPVALEITPTQFGGRRWWFTCPLVVRGVACRRRAGKLYLPPGARYFGCRKCHDLSYRSSQEAHGAERLFGRLGFSPEVARLYSAALNG